MPARPFDADWVEIREAIGRVLARIEPLSVEQIPLTAAFGRTLAQTVLSPVDQPPWDNSAMDGYAIRHRASPNGTVSIPVGPGMASRTRVLASSTERHGAAPAGLNRAPAGRGSAGAPGWLRRSRGP